MLSAGEQKGRFGDIGYGGGQRMPFACDPAKSAGRRFEEPESPTRTPFQRDRDRIIHSNAFRRLKHKTQVFIHHEGDHFRTRLTHTIEVAQIARSLARALRLDEDLAEALALAHDLGHTPFGHAGEDALSASMADYGGFEHNGHTLRIVTELECRYADFDGLNLSWETLEGIVKHNGPLEDDSGQPCGKYALTSVPKAIKDYNFSHDLQLNSFASLEAQVAAIADDIAYNAHDIDDGLRGDLFSLDDLSDVPLIGSLVQEVRESYPTLDPVRSAHELVRRMITRMIEDVILSAKRALNEVNPKSAEDVRRAGRSIINFSPDMLMADKGIKSYLFEHMYRTPKILAIRANAEQIVTDLFAHYVRSPKEMANEWCKNIDKTESANPLYQRVCDYVAGMTDRFAVQEHRRLFDETPNLR